MASLKMYPAGNGDSFLIEHQSLALLVDGGYASTFQEYVLPDLRDLSRRGLTLDLVVATHIDADHISGLVRLFADNGPADAPKIIGVRRVWHNSLRSLVPPSSDSTGLSAGDEELLREIHRRGFTSAGCVSSSEEEISALQGSSLAALLDAGLFNWNDSDGARPIAAPYQLRLSTDATLTVLGPTPDRLYGLRDWWISELRRMGIGGVIDTRPLFEDAFEFLCSYESERITRREQEISGRREGALELADVYEPDDSVINASSITFILELGNCYVLFLGDAWSEDCEAAFGSIRHKARPIVFDAIKVSHHGSRRNTSPALLSLIDSPRYLVSTNGERHNHPDIEVLKALVDRPAPFAREIYFNSTTPASRALRSHASKSATGFTVHEDYRRRIEIS
jgi:metallo-beta-lactamase superfamily protein